MKSDIVFYKNIFDSKKINGSVCVNAADPFVIKDNGFYYLVFTVAEGIKMLKSFDLIYWEDVNDDEGIVARDDVLFGAYAPEIIYNNGYYYLCTSPKGNGHYIFKSKTIDGPYKRITDNIHESIDGSFFIDNDGRTYFTRASETGIVLKRFAKSFENNDFYLFDKNETFCDAKIWGWTEGPYLIKRYGIYYLTYTGTHYLSTSYRVDYASGKTLDVNKIRFKDRLILLTSDEFSGLGHSMTFLGPNLDSYYITYHNRVSTGNRYMNISRLLFDNKGNMMLNGLDVKHNVQIDRPIFEDFISKDYYITDFIIDRDLYSIEYNFKGKNCCLIAGLNKNNKTIFKLHNNNLEIISFENNKSKIFIVELNQEYDLDVYHNLRLQYKKGLLTLYLDGVEILLKAKISLKSGGFGFENNELNNSYLAYSIHSYGSSDNDVVKIGDIFIENMISENDKLVSNKYVTKDGYYKIFIENCSLDFVMRVDNIDVDIINGCSDFIKLNEGVHQISLNKDLKKLSKICFIKNDFDQNDFDLNDLLDKGNQYGKIERINKGAYFENGRNIVLTPFECFDHEIEAELKYYGNQTDSDRFVGIVSNVNNYSFSNDFENGYSLIGHLLVLNKDYIYVIEANYYHSRVLLRQKYDNRKNLLLKIANVGKNILFYVNNKLIYNCNSVNYFPKGKCGIYSNHASALFKKVTITHRNERKKDES